MKRILILLPIVVIGAALATPAHAGKGKKGEKGEGPSVGMLLKTYDTNGNGTIDGDEVAAIKKAFDGGDAEVKKLDKDADGKLSDSEIASVKKHEKKAK